MRLLLAPPILLVTIVLILSVGTSAVVAGTAGLTSSEKAWVSRLVPLITNVADASSEIARDSQDPDILVPGSNTQLRLAVALAVYQNCASTLARKGKPPTSRLLPVRKALTGACGAYGRAARLIAIGIDRFDAASLRAGAAAMQLGTTYTSRANAALLALR